MTAETTTTTASSSQHHTLMAVPFEILIEIASFLPHFPDVVRLRQVCKLLTSVVDSPACWRRVRFDTAPFVVFSPPSSSSAQDPDREQQQSKRIRALRNVIRSLPLSQLTKELRLGSTRVIGDHELDLLASRCTGLEHLSMFPVIRLDRLPNQQQQQQQQQPINKSDAIISADSYNRLIYASRSTLVKLKIYPFEGITFDLGSSDSAEEEANENENENENNHKEASNLFPRLQRLKVIYRSRRLSTLNAFIASMRAKVPSLSEISLETPVLDSSSLVSLRSVVGHARSLKKLTIGRDFFPHCSEESVEVLLRECPLLEEIRLTGFSLLSSRLFLIIAQNCPRIRDIKISTTMLTNTVPLLQVSPSSSSSSASSAPSSHTTGRALYSIDRGGGSNDNHNHNHNHDHNHNHPLEQFPPMQHLQSLAMNQMGNLFSQDFAALISRCPNLQVFEWMFRPVDVDKCSLSCFAALRQLKRFTFTMANCDEEDIIKMFTSCTELESVKLFLTSVCTDRVLLVAGSHLHKLEDLQLRSLTFSLQGGIQALVDGCRALQSLELTRCEMEAPPPPPPPLHPGPSSTVDADWPRGGPRFASLRSLTLRGVKGITKRGLVALLRTAGHTIEHLSLLELPVEDVTARSLLVHISNLCPRLLFLSLVHLSLLPQPQPQPQPPPQQHDDDEYEIKPMASLERLWVSGCKGFDRELFDEFKATACSSNPQFCGNFDEHSSMV